LTVIVLERYINNLHLISLLLLSATGKDSDLTDCFNPWSWVGLFKSK